MLAAGIGHHFETSNAGLLSEVEDVHQCLVSERGGQHADAETFRLYLQPLVLAGSRGPCLVFQFAQCHDSDGTGCRSNKSPSCDVLHVCVVACLGGPLIVIADWWHFIPGC